MLLLWILQYSNAVSRSSETGSVRFSSTISNSIQRARLQEDGSTFAGSELILCARLQVLGSCNSLATLYCGPASVAAHSTDLKLPKDVAQILLSSHNSGRWQAWHLSSAQGLSLSSLTSNFAGCTQMRGCHPE